MSEHMRRMVASWQGRGGERGRGCVDGVEDHGDGPGELLSSSERIRQARVAIIATKWAYRAGESRWLGLWARAVALIERCPEEVRGGLMVSLSVFLERVGCGE